MTIGEKIRAVRQQKGFSQEMLQQKSGVQRNSISLIENNHRGVSYHTLEKIANALSLSVGEITDYQPPSLYPPIEQFPLPTLQVAEATKSGQYLSQHLWDERYLPVPIIDEALISHRLFPDSQDKIKDYALIQRHWFPEPQQPERYCCFCPSRPEQAIPPLIEPGSLVCIDYGQRDPIQLKGKIVAFYDDEGGCSLRRLQLKGKNIIGLPLDSSYSPLVFPASKKERLIGRLIWYFSLLSS